MKDTIIALSTKLTVDVEQATANLSVEDSRHCRHFAANSLLCNAIISAEDYMVGFCATLGSMAEAIQARFISASGCRKRTGRIFCHAFPPACFSTRFG